MLALVLDIKSFLYLVYLYNYFYVFINLFIFYLKKCFKIFERCQCQWFGVPAKCRIDGNHLVC